MRANFALRISFVLSLASLSLGAIGPVSNLYIGNAVVAPDGFSRAAVLAGNSANNLTAIGPLIQASLGDQFRLNVVNRLKDTRMLRTTSIHWHGFFQNGTAWADGVVGATQCPIIPGESFEYRFQSPNQAGTFWYHSHHSTQYCDGLRGPMVVYDPNDPHKNLYDHDNENTVITVGDWYHKFASEASSALGLEPNSTLINGYGRYPTGPLVSLAVINVVQNKRYRFRLVNIACEPSYNVSIDAHDMTIIEVEGENVQPYTVTSLEIFSGQRYSVVVNANQPVGNYRIRANPSFGPRGYDNGINSAILRYAGAPAREPTTADHSHVNPMKEKNLHSLINPAAPGIAKPGAADENINLKIDLNILGQFTINGAVFQPPTLPVLLQLMNGAPAKQLLPSGSVYTLPRNRVIEISIPGTPPQKGSPHPMHLHGHAFDVIRVAGSTDYNFINPPRRDVVNTGTENDNVTIRFRTNNPGPWILHCHVDWHLEYGLAVVFAEEPSTISAMKPPAAWDELCPTYQNFPGPDSPTRP
ncbi:hypothetical protein CVT24_010297 [Panaeolus cyanescens]|uniref:Laccase n=1 Tax=Panaeolus cyanescens TaxID=181874 RepID=A0A409YQB5_9AGAR|nr:hypothetical protein CVT24_010297 [Panaeolus cyanescens]